MEPTSGDSLSEGLEPSTKRDQGVNRSNSRPKIQKITSDHDLSPVSSISSQDSTSKDSDRDETPELQITMADVLAAVPLRIWAVIVTLTTLLAASPIFLGIAATLAIATTLLTGLTTFTTYRYWHITRSRVRSSAGWNLQGPDLSALPEVYWMYILGSGGHTSEMIQTIKASLHVGRNVHRRYVVTTGDRHSRQAAHRLEQSIRRKFGRQSGTSDVLKIQRARAVHQSLLSAIVPALWTVFETIGLLTRVPGIRSTEKHGDTFRYPSVILTNGPGTCFIVAIVAFALKVFYVIPETKCKVIYIETWAHVSSLSLTGKLFDKLDMADLFCVQHQSLATKLGKFYLPVVSMPQPRLVG